MVECSITNSVVVVRIQVMPLKSKMDFFAKIGNGFQLSDDWLDSEYTYAVYYAINLFAITMNYCVK